LVAALLGVVMLAPAGALRSDTDPFEQQLEFGADMARRGLWKEALFRFQQADRIQPGNAHVLNNIAVSFEALGLFDKALESYQQALKASPDDKELRSNYSRFIEFYQSFRPDGPTTGSDAGSEIREIG
jgi:tetratricopeptide (TPR) repeat protein